MRYLAIFLSLAAAALGQAVPPNAPIFLTQPQAGPPGGGTFGTMSIQNANNVSIAGGTTGNLTGTGNTEINLTLQGAVTYVSSGSGQGGFNVFLPYSMPALAIDVTQEWNTVILTGSTTGHPNEVLTFTGTPGNFVQEFRVLVKNTDSVAHTPTIPSSWSFNGGATETSFVIQPSSFVFLTWRYDGTAYYLWGDPRTISDLATNASPLSTDLIAEEPTATPGVMNKVAISALPFQHSLTFVVAGNGTALMTGTQTAYIMAGYAGTITKWKLTAAPASSNISFDIFRIASASSGLNVLPTATIVGTGTKPSVTTGIEAYGTPSDWVAGSGSITLAENDVLTVKVNTTSTTTYATLTLYYQ